MPHHQGGARVANLSEKVNATLFASETFRQKAGYTLITSAHLIGVTDHDDGRHRPYSNYCLTVRLALLNKPGIFAKVAALLAEEGANLGAVDIVSANAERMIRDITFDVQNEAHGERVLERLEALPEVNVLSASDRIFLLHLGEKSVQK